MVVRIIEISNIKIFQAINREREKNVLRTYFFATIITTSVILTKQQKASLATKIIVIITTLHTSLTMNATLPTKGEEKSRT